MRRRTIALMYHALGDTTDESVDAHYRVTLDRFSQQLDRCKRAGGAVSARDWLAGKDGVIYTFDDGGATDYRHAFPTLKQAGGGADFFVNPAQVGTAGFATWSELREMAEGGMSIQSHGWDHGYFLTELSPERLREDLRRARVEIEQRTGHPCTLLAPPGGRSPKGLEAAALKSGYTHVLDSRPGRVVDGPRTLCRLAVTSQLDVGTLDSWLRGGRALWQAQLRYSLLDVAKRVLGDERYQSVRARLLG